MRDHSYVKVQCPQIEILFCRRDIITEWTHSSKMLKVPYWRLYYPYNSNGILKYQSRKIRMETGSFYLIAPETPFGSDLDGGTLDKLYIHFLVTGEYEQCRNDIQQFTADSNIRALADLASEKMLAFENTPKLGMNLIALCSAALSLLPPEQLNQSQHVEPGLFAIWHRIQDNPSREYCNAELASELGISPSAFCRRFLSAFGIPPQQFVLEERLRHAASLLLSSDLSIDEIADKVGFCDRYYFTRAFSKYRNISPARFRRGNH